MPAPKSAAARKRIARLRKPPPKKRSDRPRKRRSVLPKRRRSRRLLLLLLQHKQKTGRWLGALPAAMPPLLVAPSPLARAVAAETIIASAASSPSPARFPTKTIVAPDRWPRSVVLARRKSATTWR